MTWQTDEQADEFSRPVELYVFQTPTTTYRLTSYYRDFVYGGNTYTSIPEARSNLITADASQSSSDDFSVEIPATHALAQAYAGFIPPREVVVTVLRYQPISNLAMAIGGGYVTALSFKGRMASFRVPGASDAFATQINAVSASRICNHILYDSLCTLDRAAFAVAATVIAITVDHKIVTVSTIGGHPDQWFQHGEILHTTTQERRSISDQTGTVVKVTYREPVSVGIGDSITLYAGCDHTIGTCKTKFSNVGNFGGLPRLPISNPFYILGIPFKNMF